MLNICGSTIPKPLAIIFKQCVDTVVFESEWQKSNIVPIYKRGDKQTLKSYPPVLILPTCEKVLERLMFNEMLIFLIENSLISTNQAGFKPGGFCTCQQVSITHEIYKFFDKDHETRGVSLDISKAFNEVWHDGIILKLTQKRNTREFIQALA